jgi:hypothetical protein
MHIERLVLEDYSRTDGRRIVAELEAELRRRLAEGGVPEAWSGSDLHVDRLHLAPAPAATPQALGAGLAAATYDAGRPSRPTVPTAAGPHAASRRE